MAHLKESADVPSAPVQELALKAIHPLLRDFSTAHNVTYESCLDIGCGRSRYDTWFGRFGSARAPHRYIGLDSDPVIIEELRADGVDARDPFDDPGECASELTLCIEVVEHIRPEDTPDFFAFARDNTEKVLALTTPNFEYWDGIRAKPEYRECRWIPDHLPFFRPDGGPHDHKQAMTPANLTAYFEQVFPADEWGFEVYRAWPWHLEDLATGNSFDLHFKLFALAWRRSLVAD
jgi:hypothetical protein